MSASNQTLPDDLSQLVVALATALRAEPGLIREVVLNAYRRGYGDGKLAGISLALETAEAEMGVARRVQ